MRFLRKLLEIPNTPAALQSREFEGPDFEGYCWEDFEKEAKEKYPIRSYLKDLESDFHVAVTMRIEHFIYWIESYTTRRKHWLDLRQPKGTKLGDTDHYRWGYIDHDHQLLYANFNILVNHLKARDNSKHNYSIEEYIEVLKKEECDTQPYEDMIDILEYWTVTRKAQAKELSDLLSKWSKARHTPAAEPFWNAMQEAEKAFEEEETNILIKLIKIRKYMWL